MFAEIIYILGSLLLRACPEYTAISLVDFWAFSSSQIETLYSSIDMSCCPSQLLIYSLFKTFHTHGTLEFVVFRKFTHACFMSECCSLIWPYHTVSSFLKCMFRYLPVWTLLNNAAINVCVAGFYVCKVFSYCSAHFYFNLTS